MLCIGILPAAVGEYNIIKAGRLSYCCEQHKKKAAQILRCLLPYGEGSVF